MDLTTELRTVDYAAAAEAASLPAATRLGQAELTVTDLGRSVPFYEDVVGLTELWRGRTETDEPAVALGSADSEPVILLVESPSAPQPGRRAGLYHVALRYPDRAELAHLVRRLSEQRTPVQGASDHGTHEAIYLPDPDGNGLELETDRPREQWPPMAEEFARGGPRPLDIQQLITEAADEPTRPRSAGVDMGHLHLHVGDTEAAEAFYRDVLGMATVAAIPSAVFMSAGGYHHHVAFNTWRGQGIPPVRPDAIGLRRWTVVVPNSDDLTALSDRIERSQADAPGHAPQARTAADGSIELSDPSGNVVVVRSEATPTRSA